VRTPRVTVIVPAFNSESTLRRALDSIVVQTFPSWQAVVADDGSSDRTARIAEEFAERFPDRIRVIRLARNSGPAAARNAALAEADGTEFIALLDADDALLPQFLERQVELYDRALDDGRRPGIVSCNAYFEAADGERIGTFDQIQGWVDPVGYDDLIERTYVFVSALFPRAAIDRVGNFSTDCWGSEDSDLWLRIVEAGYEVIPNPEPLVVYRVRSDSVSSSEIRMAEAGIVFYRRALDRCTQSSARRRKIRKRLLHYRALWFRARLADAVAKRDWLDAVRLALRALPLGLAAALQDPARWGEWTKELLQAAPGAWLRARRLSRH
jgi:glycosyltransferase involved in cell wall biosynthesis